jgi:hypothetical protein
LPVQALDGGGNGEAGRESSSAELGCTTARCEDSTDCDVFNEFRVDAGALNESLESAVEQVGALGVLETTLATLCDGRSQGTCDDDLEGAVS